MKTDYVPNVKMPSDKQKEQRLISNINIAAQIARARQPDGGDFFAYRVDHLNNITSLGLFLTKEEADEALQETENE